jgi:transketolase
MNDSQLTNVIRCLAVDTVQGANSGHPGAPMGMAPIAHVLWSNFLKYDPKEPHWDDRDRFVLSNGHASALLYTMLHLTGYNLSVEELKKFRQLNSKTPGHPERHVTPGVEVTTGPLGQGISNAVGLAIAEAHLAAVFNRPNFPVVDHYTYVFCGDGCLMEGITQESISLAGHLGLEKLIVVYDDNKITIDGNTSIAFTEKTEAKMQALGWHTIVVENGDSDFAHMRAALEEARAVRGKPKIILLRTTIGYGSKLQGTEKVHGAPLGPAEIKRVKEAVFHRDPS